ncbi:sulfurtransferase TusA family protein [Methylococcus mesophilus]|uniref:sulfurtransferase TusA family protein n=1 Tax=Methylococcus mesophilus TaxID=2993564 RepID=UPI00224A8FCB|nr:sulfurtransferase TusA family protein [Methylococcus mesophilus]UZR28997.1 sulfurtransferase TusA family protein [Methylococcus mesophilus]
MITIDQELDTSGLMCPLPLLRLKKTLQLMGSGQTVRVRATDPASVLDFGVYLEQAGHDLVEYAEETGAHLFLIRKG